VDVILKKIKERAAREGKAEDAVRKAF